MNEHSCEILTDLFKRMRKASKKNNVLDQRLFDEARKLITDSKPISFKEATSRIGRSLRDDFSEIDSQNDEGHRNVSYWCFNL